jgi:hypothetical protein
MPASQSSPKLACKRAIAVCHNHQRHRPRVPQERGKDRTIILCTPLNVPSLACCFAESQGGTTILMPAWQADPTPGIKRALALRVPISVPSLASLLAGVGHPQRCMRAQP